MIIYSKILLQQDILFIIIIFSFINKTCLFLNLNLLYNILK